MSGVEARKALLLTRPLDQSRALARELAARGFRTVLAPMSEIVPEPFVLPRSVESYDALIFTSANGVRAFAAAESFRASPCVHAVGAATAEAAHDAGFETVFAAGGDSAALVRTIESQKEMRGRRMLHLSGAHVAGEELAALAGQGIEIDRVVCYRARAAKALPDEAAAFLRAGEVGAALFFSARAAEIFGFLAAAAGCTEALPTLGALCLSRRVVKSLPEGPWREIRTARTPDMRGMLALLEEA